MFGNGVNIFTVLHSIQTVLNTLLIAQQEQIQKDEDSVVLGIIILQPCSLAQALLILKIEEIIILALELLKTKTQHTMPHKINYSVLANYESLNGLS
jgi:hypothetical protein